MTSSRSRRADDRLSVLVCRGCCCGTVGKHPDVDHAGHLAALQTAVDAVAGATLFTVDCLDQCDRSNVVVIRASGERRWFGGMLDDGSVADLAGWIVTGGRGDVPDAVAAHAFDPDAPIAGMGVMDPRHGPALAQWVAELLGAAGGWTMGVHGALAEFDAAGCVADLDPLAATVTATGPGGALRMHITDDTRAFTVGRPDAPEVPVVVLFGRIDPGPPICRRVTEVGLDVDAIDPGARGDTLVDLGVGRSSAFMIRSGDPACLEQLRASVGGDWRDVPSDIDGTRVVITNVGRIETSDARRTHVRPSELETGIDLPLGLRVPKGFVVGALHFPASSTSTIDAA